MEKNIRNYFKKIELPPMNSAFIKKIDSIFKTNWHNEYIEGLRELEDMSDEYTVYFDYNPDSEYIVKFVNTIETGEEEHYFMATTLSLIPDNILEYIYYNLIEIYDENDIKKSLNLLNNSIRKNKDNYKKENLKELITYLDYSKKIIKHFIKYG